MPRLTTPVVEEGWYSDHPLFSRYKINRGITLLVLGATVTEAQFPDQESLGDYDYVYLGGHEYVISSAEADTLTDAGYGEYIVAGDFYIHASDYGALFDGSTDDSDAIQQAVNAAIAQSKPLFLPPGVAMIGTGVNISDTITVIGSGRQETTLKAAAGLNNYVLTFTSASADGTVGAHFVGFTIDGNCGGQNAGGGINAAGAVQCHFERMHFINCFNWGLVLGPISGGGFGHHNRIVGCLFDCTIQSAGYGGGVHCTSSDENWFSMSDFEYLGGTAAPIGSNPVALLDQAGLQKIVNANFVGGRNNAIHIRSQDTKLCQIVACTFDGSAGDSVFLTGTRHQVLGCTFTSPGDQGSTPASGIYLEFGTRGCVVTGNVLETAVAAGKTYTLIRESGDGGAGGNIIAHNSLYQNAAPTLGTLTDFSGAGSTTTPNVEN